MDQLDVSDSLFLEVISVVVLLVSVNKIYCRNNILIVGWIHLSYKQEQ